MSHAVTATLVQTLLVPWQNWHNWKWSTQINQFNKCKQQALQVSLSLVVKAGRNCYKLAIRATEEDRKGQNRKTVSITMLKKLARCRSSCNFFEHDCHWGFCQWSKCPSDISTQRSAIVTWFKGSKGKSCSVLSHPSAGVGGIQTCRSLVKMLPSPWKLSWEHVESTSRSQLDDIRLRVLHEEHPRISSLDVDKIFTNLADYKIHLQFNLLLALEKPFASWTNSRNFPILNSCFFSGKRIIWLRWRTTLRGIFLVCLNV